MTTDTMSMIRTAEEHARSERRNADVKTYSSVGLVAGGLVWATSNRPPLSLPGAVVWNLGLAAGVVAVLALWWTGMPGIVWRAQPGTRNVFELHAAERAGRLGELLTDGESVDPADAVRQVAAMSRLAVRRYVALWVGQALAVVAAGLLGLAWFSGGLS